MTKIEEIMKEYNEAIEYAKSVIVKRDKIKPEKRAGQRRIEAILNRKHIQNEIDSLPNDMIISYWEDQKNALYKTASQFDPNFKGQDISIVNAFLSSKGLK